MRLALSISMVLLSAACFGQNGNGGASGHQSAPAQVSTPTTASPTPTDNSGACPVGSTSNELEQEQDDLTRNIGFLEIRARAVNSALLSMNSLLQDIPSQSVPIDQYQAPALGALKTVTAENVGSKDVPVAVSTLVRAYRVPFDTLSSPPGLGEEGSGDPEVSSIVSRYGRSVRDIIAKHPAYQLEMYGDAPAVPRATLVQAVNDLNGAAFKQDISSVSQELTTAIGELNALQKRVNAATDSARACRTQVIDKRGEETFMNRLAIRYGLPWFCLTAMALFLIPQIIRAGVLVYKPDLSSQLGFSVDKIIELVTILFISLTILILGLASKIDGQVLGTLLGGISGYVLNRISRQEGAQSAVAKPPQVNPPGPPPAVPPVVVAAPREEEGRKV
jgi:hypothetical protein